MPSFLGQEWCSAVQALKEDDANTLPIASPIIFISLDNFRGHVLACSDHGMRGRSIPRSAPIEELSGQWDIPPSSRASYQLLRRCVPLDFGLFRMSFLGANCFGVVLLILFIAVNMNAERPLEVFAMPFVV